MASPVNNVLAGGEEDENPIPGSDEDNTGDFTDQMGGAPTSTPPIAPAPSPATPKAPVQVDSAQKVHPHMAILAGLLNRVLGGIQNAPGNPRNAFDRGFMNASPNQQALTQASISQAKSAADLEKMQVSITGLKALQLEYMIKRLPQQQQEEHLKTVSEFKQALVKDGANIEAEGTDEKASDAQAVHLNATDPRATSHAGRFYSLPTMDTKGNAQFDVVFVPNKNVLQDDFPYKDSDGNDKVIPKGTPFAGGFAKLVDDMKKDVSGQTKERAKQLGELLKPAASPEVVDQQLSQLQAIQKEGGPEYQANKQKIDQTIQGLQAAQAGADRRAKEAAARIEERHDEDSVYAYDPETKTYELTTKKEAAGRTSFKATPAFEKSLGRAQRIEDVSNKMLDYRDSFSEGLETSDKHAIENFLSDHPAMLTGPGVGSFKISLGAEGAGLDEAARDLDQRSMPQAAKNRLNAFIIAKTTALEMQKIESDTGRMSTGGMQLDLGAIARPTDDPDTALGKIDKFMRSVKTFSRTKVRGIPTAEEIESGRPFVGKTKTPTREESQKQTHHAHQ